jgi:hypothetical protein
VARRSSSLVAFALVSLAGCGDLGSSSYVSTPKVACGQIPNLRATWRTGSGRDAEKRRRTVAAYAIDCAAFRGMSRARVRHAIGKPDDADRREMWFVLGPDPLGIDAENLVVSFDADGRATKAEQVQS